MSGPRPLSRQRSAWERTAMPMEFDGHPAAVWRRLVGDGALYAIVAEEPAGWHMSISFRDKRDRLTRYPRWDEISHARYELLPHDVDFVMHLPPPDEYVAVHDTTFHLHEHPERAT